MTTKHKLEIAAETLEQRARFLRDVREHLANDPDAVLALMEALNGAIPEQQPKTVHQNGVGLRHGLSMFSPRGTRRPTHFDKIVAVFVKNENAWMSAAELAVATGLAPTNIRRMVYSQRKADFDRNKSEKNSKFRLKPEGYEKHHATKMSGERR